MELLSGVNESMEEGKYMLISEFDEYYQFLLKILESPTQPLLSFLQNLPD